MLFNTLVKYDASLEVFLVFMIGRTLSLVCVLAFLVFLCSPYMVKSMVLCCGILITEEHLVAVVQSNEYCCIVLLE